MIVASGALMLVALVLLVVGLAATTLTFVYVSIAASALACVFLVVHSMRARSAARPAQPADPTTDNAAPAGRAAPPVDDAGSSSGQERRPVPTQLPELPPAEDDDIDVEDLGLDGAVLVQPGHPRYHVEGCRHLAGLRAEQVSLRDAREEGFTPCGTCTPNLVLAERALEDDDEQVATRPGASDASAGADSPTRAAVAAAGQSGQADPTRHDAGHAETGVVVLPDRGSYHRPQCRFVRGVAAAQQVSRDEAVRQGYDACGSCRP